MNIARNHAIDYTRSKEFNKDGKTVSLSENVNSGDGLVQSCFHDPGLKKLIEGLPEEGSKLLELSYYLGKAYLQAVVIILVVRDNRRRSLAFNEGYKRSSKHL